MGCGCHTAPGRPIIDMSMNPLARWRIRLRVTGWSGVSTAVVAGRYGPMVSSCRDEILAVWPRLAAGRQDGTVEVQEVVNALACEGSRYSESTIRTHVASRMTLNAPDHHAIVYADLERVERGRYRLRTPVKSPAETERGRGACLCGCGEVTGVGRALFRPGHDARMVSHVARAVLGGPEKADALVATLPSEALRAKARAMIVKRRGKTLARPESPQPASSNEVVAEPLPGVPAGDSSVQRAAETMMLDTLAQLLGVPLVSERIYLPDGSRVEIDGFSAQPPVLVEAWAHQGPPKAAQRNKVLGDALKLLHVSAMLDGGHRRILCFSDSAAAWPFTGRSWYAGALRALGIEVHVVHLPDAWRQRILDAQHRQYR